MAARRFSGRRILGWLIAFDLATIAALAGAIWFELSDSVASGLFAIALILALLSAVCAARTVADTHALLPYRERPSLSERGAGVLTLVVLGALAIACIRFVQPRSWAASVEEAVSILSARLDAESERELAYMTYDDLIALQDTLGASLREQFGLNRGNHRLLRDCDPEYMNPQSCSTIIVSRLWKQARAGLPPAQRLPLEALERKMEQVRFESDKFHDVPLEELIAFFNGAIRAQLPEDAQFEIRHDPALGSERVSISWHRIGTVSLREALAVLSEKAQLNVRKDPPNLATERRRAAPRAGRPSQEHAT